MAQNRTGYRTIDDTEVDAESPLTESLMLALRDQCIGNLSVAATTAPATEKVQLPERAKATTTDTGLYLRPDGSGGVEFVDLLGSAKTIFTDSAHSNTASTGSSTVDVLDLTIAENNVGVAGAVYNIDGFWNNRALIGRIKVITTNSFEIGHVMASLDTNNATVALNTVVQTRWTDGGTFDYIHQISVTAISTNSVTIRFGTSHNGIGPANNHKLLRVTAHAP